MSYFEIGIYNGKTKMNLGTLWRSAHQLGASGLFTINGRYQGQASDTSKAYRHVPLRQYKTFEEFKQLIPQGTALIGIEMGGKKLKNFVHPKRCIYLLGAEDQGLPQKIIDQCDYVIALESVNQPSYNVAVAGSIAMYDRINKGGK